MLFEVVKIFVVGYCQKFDYLAVGGAVATIGSESCGGGDGKTGVGVVVSIVHAIECDIQVEIAAVEGVPLTKSIVSEVDALDYAIRHKV